MPQNKENNNQSFCLNCQTSLTEDALYCSSCGQKNTDGRISLKEFIHNFFDNVFNLDSRIFRTMKLLCLPGRLTIEYFEGKHRTFYHPIRLYLVMSLIFFAILSLKKDGDSFMNFDMDEGPESFMEEAQKEKHFLEYKAKLDSLGQLVLHENTHPKARQAIDSLFLLLPKQTKRDSLNVVLAGGKAFKIDQIDMMILNADQIIEKYKIEGFFYQVATKQVVRFMKDQGLFSRQMASNFPVMLLVLMPALAFCLKLLYARRKRYFVEHLVFSFHHHAFAFFLFSILFLFEEKYFEYIMSFGIIAVMVFLFMAMRRVYQQGFGKTFLKFTIFNFFYLFSFLIALAFTFIFSFLLF